MEGREGREGSPECKEKEPTGVSNTQDLSQNHESYPYFQICKKGWVLTTSTGELFCPWGDGFAVAVFESQEEATTFVGLSTPVSTKPHYEPHPVYLIVLKDTPSEQYEFIWKRKDWDKPAAHRGRVVNFSLILTEALSHIPQAFLPTLKTMIGSQQRGMGLTGDPSKDFLVALCRI